jgi:hypothetical protein
MDPNDPMIIFHMVFRHTGDTSVIVMTKGSRPINLKRKLLGWTSFLTVFLYDVCQNMDNDLAS